MIDDLELVKECLNGNQNSYRVIYERYKGYCYSICVRYGIKSSEIKDCMQIIFMEVFKSLSSYNPVKAQFKTWLTKITINQIIQHKRKLRVLYYSLDNEVVNLDTQHFNLSIDSKIDEEIMYSVLSKMPKKYSTVFNLFIVDGYTHAEIAKLLGIKENASRILLHRGRNWAMEQLNFFCEEAVSKFKKSI